MSDKPNDSKFICLENLTLNNTEIEVMDINNNSNEYLSYDIEDYIAQNNILEIIEDEIEDPDNFILDEPKVQLNDRKHKCVLLH